MNIQLCIYFRFKSISIKPWLYNGMLRGACDQLNKQGFTRFDSHSSDRCLLVLCNKSEILGRDKYLNDSSLMSRNMSRSASPLLKKMVVELDKRTANGPTLWIARKHFAPRNNNSLLFFSLFLGTRGNCSQQRPTMPKITIIWTQLKNQTETLMNTKCRQFNDLPKY